MDRTPSIEDPYLVFAQLTDDPYLSQLSPLAPTPHSAREPTSPSAPTVPPTPSAPQAHLSPPGAQPDCRVATPHDHPTGPDQPNNPLQAPYKRYPKFSSPSTTHTPLLSTLRRHLVAILRSRIPLSNEDISNPFLEEALVGPLTIRAWRLTYDLVDLDDVGFWIGGDPNREKCKEVKKLKKRLVRELVECVEWDVGMDGGWEAGRLVEDLWPRGRSEGEGRGYVGS